MDIKDWHRILEYLKTDLKLVKDSEYHVSVHDLLNMMVLEEIPMLIEFIERVNSHFSVEMPKNPTGPYAKGYMDSYNDSKRNLYEKK